MLEGFKKFILRGNVVDLAVGVVIGAAFNSVVNSLVKGMLTPLIGAIVRVPDFSYLYFTLNGSRFMYGEFINSVISFVIVAAAVYFFVIIPLNKLMARFIKEPLPDPNIIKCPECLSDIPKDSKRCRFCTAPLVK